MCVVCVSVCAQLTCLDSTLLLLWELIREEAARTCWRAGKEGEGWMRGGVWPNALSPRCCDKSCW